MLLAIVTNPRIFVQDMRESYAKGRMFFYSWFPIFHVLSIFFILIYEGMSITPIKPTHNVTCVVRRTTWMQVPAKEFEDLHQLRAKIVILVSMMFL